MPQPPHKKNDRGQYPVGFSAEDISFRAHEGYLTLAGCEIELPDLCPYPFLNANGEFDPKRNYGHALHVIISPSRYGYWINVVYANAGAIPDISASHTKVAGSDVGVDPLFTISPPPTIRLRGRLWLVEAKLFTTFVNGDTLVRRY